jgi:hypothetical protein
MDASWNSFARRSCALATVAASLAPALALAQTSPFQTGATALQADILTIATPVAIILIMVLGVVAATGSIGLPISALRASP